jgi:hypothetical protein
LLPQSLINLCDGGAAHTANGAADFLTRHPALMLQEVDRDVSRLAVASKNKILSVTPKIFGHCFKDCLLAHRGLKRLPTRYFFVFKQILIQPIQGLPDKSLTAQDQPAINALQGIAQLDADAALNKFPVRP